MTIAVDNTLSIPNTVIDDGAAILAGGSTTHVPHSQGVYDAITASLSTGLPSQTGHGGGCLTTNGTAAAWANVGQPTGGVTGQVLTKDSGADFDSSWHTVSLLGGGVPSVNAITSAVTIAGANVSTAGSTITIGHDIPTGGSTGQALVKNSATNYDVAWGTVGGGVSNATNLPYTAPWTGAVSIYQQAVNNRRVNIDDFSGATDNIKTQAAFDYAVANNLAVEVSRKITLTSSINIDRLVDTMNQWLHVYSVNGGGFYTANNISLFDSTLTTTTLPQSEKVAFHNMQFECASGATAQVLSSKFLRVEFVFCNFYRISAMISTIFGQQINFTKCSAKAVTGTFFKCVGAGSIKSFGCSFEAGCADIFMLNSSGGYGNMGCSFMGDITEGNTGTYLTAAGVLGLTVTGCYSEGNGGRFINLAPSGGGANKGVHIAGNFIASSSTNLANSSFYEVVCGTTTGLSSSGNQCSGRLYSNASCVMFPNGDKADITLLSAPNTGTWTATWSGTGTVTNTLARSTRINENLCLIEFDLTFPTYTNASFAVIGGLPYVGAAATFIGTLGWSGATAAGSSLVGGSAQAGSQSFWVMRDGHGTPSSHTDLSGKRVTGSLLYSI